MDKYINKYNDIQPIKFSTDNNNKSTIQNRLKSKVVWVSIASLLLPIFGHLGLYKATGITEDSLKITIDTILSALVIVGILNNPLDSEKF
jgi:uncharacterized membrane protein